MIEKHKLIYLAGIVDGEGCFWRGKCVNGQGRRYLQSRLCIDNTNREIIDWLIENFGSNAWVKKPYKAHWSIAWSWRINGKKAEELAKRLQPYLIIKREQVKRVLPEYKEYLVN